MPLPAALLKDAQAIMKFGKSAKAASEFVTKLGGDILNLGNNADRTAKKIIHSADLISKRWVLMQDAAFKTARTMAMSRQQALEYNKQLIDSTRELASQYGITSKELADFQKTYSEAVGRNIVLTKEQLAHMSALAKITDNATASQLVDEFDKIGIGVRSSLAHVGHMQEKAKAFGVNATKASKSLASNIKLASMYSFKNGVADIEKMTIQSAALRANMDAIMRSSEKFSTIEGAIETSAKLQMLGGHVGAFGANPMGNMYNALADPAKYMDDVTKMAKSLVTYDKKTGETTMNPIQSMTANAAAESLGMSKQEFMEMAYAGVKNDAVMQQVGDRGFSKEQMEAIANLARGNFDETTGKYFVTWLQDGKEQKRYVDELAADELKIAQDSQATEENMRMDVKDIKTILERVHGRARDTKSVAEAEQGIESWWDAQITNIQDIWMKPLSGLYNGISNWLGKQQHFAEGGIVKPLHASMGAIVPGDSYMGDHTPVMANGGEMILTPMQQKSMFNLISSLALNGGVMYGVNKLGGKFGAKGLGSTMLMANMIGGGDAGIKEYIEAHFLQKFIKNINPFKKSVEQVGKVSAEATKSTSLFNTNWKEFTNTLSKDLSTITGKLSETWGNFARKISVTSRRYFTTGKWGKITGAASRTANAIGKYSAAASGFTAKHAKSLGEAIGKHIITPVSDEISKGWESLKGSKFGLATQRKIGDAQLKLIRAKLGYNGIVKPKAKEYSRLIRNLFNDGSKAQASKIVSREGATSVSKVAETATKEVSSVAKAAGNSGKLLSGLGKAGKILGKKIPYIGTALSIGGAVSGMMDASSQYDAKVDKINSSNMSELDKARAKDRATKQKNAGIGGSIGSAAGSLGGMAAGATTGAAIGSVIPVVGTAIGGILGGAIGAFGGEKLGGLFGKGIGSLFGGNEEKKVKEKEEKILGIDEGSIKNREDLVKYVKSIDSKIGIKHSIGLTPLSLPRINPITDIMTSAVRSLPIVGNFMRVLPSVRENGQNAIQPIGKTDINLNVSGTIKLDGGGKMADLDVSKLLDTPEFKRQLADIITRRINENSNGGKRNMESERNNMASQYNKSGS